MSTATAQRAGKSERRGETDPAAAVRCAIYTRKSTEEGLDQEFNSLDAQREAGEAYIQSQRSQGWVALPDRYDDGGFSGANVDRPALQRLLRDVEAGAVDCVVVYKVDRLSRSLLDFARMVEIFDQHEVSFVSVTQQFSTTTSIGRLTLNMLLSFAQFEREINSERTRDKMSAARRKGKWVGGTPVLGYDVHPDGGKLVVNEDEAALVREIFGLYLKHRSLLPVVAELNRRGAHTKSWVTKKGLRREGKPLDKPRLHRMLTNIIYLGKVNHKGEIYPGEHPAITDEKVFAQVQELLRRNGRTGGGEVRNRSGALLKGIVRCAPCDAAMIHSTTLKKRRRYRYYVCTKAQKQGWDTCPSKSVSAQEIETFVVDRIREIGKDPELVGEVIRQVKEGQAARMPELDAERRRLERDLRQYNSEVRRLVGAIGDGNGRGNAVSDRLAELEERSTTAERRLTEVREELLTIERERVDEDDVTRALSLFDPIWDVLYPNEQARIIQLLIERVDYDGAEGTLAISFRPSGIKTLAQEAVS